MDTIDPLMEALLDLEAEDDAITDPDFAAALSTGFVDIQMIIDSADPAEAIWSRRSPPSARRSTLSAMPLRAGRPRQQ
jgi:hypothetical protein